jgi:hypothetical protein
MTVDKEEETRGEVEAKVTDEKKGFDHGRERGRR